MRLVDHLYALTLDAAAGTSVAAVTIGLGYTAVTTAEGNVGLSYTMLERTACCSHVRAYRDFDGAPAVELLESVRSDDTLERAMGIALVNALNRPRARRLPNDDAPGGAYLKEFAVRAGTTVAMVGYFPPLARRLEEEGAEVRALDSGQHIGDEATFMRDLASWPDVLIVTATTILNDSLELILERAPTRAKVMLLGPTTPLLPEAFADLPVHLLAGLVPVDNERVVAAVRQGAGTPVLLKHCRKVYWARGSGA